MNFYFYSKYNGKSTIEQLRRVTFFVSSSSFHIVYTRYVDTELKYLSKYENKEDSFKNHEIGEAAEDYVEALIEGKQMAYLIDKDYTKWHQEYEDEVFEESTEAVYKLNSIKKITFENEEYQQMFDRLVKYGEEYSKRD